jgi:signal transduction histidine kinase/transcriptional regulator with GAF, ATPase, and Fis domain
MRGEIALSGSRSLLRRYGLAVVAVLATLALRFVADPAFAGRAGYVAFILPVALAAWAGGLGPGLVATAISLGIVFVAFVSPTFTLRVDSVADVTYALTFAIAGVVVSVLASGLRVGRERAEAHAFRAQRLQAVAAALSAELTASEAADAVLREGISALGAGKGVIALVDPGGETLRLVAAVGYDQAGWDRFAHFPVDAPYPVSEAVRLREPITIADGDELRTRYPSLSGDIHEGGSAIVIPLLDKSGPVGGGYYRFAEVRSFSRDDLEYVRALGSLCAAALERARLHDQQVRAGERAAFLARASAALAAPLDVEATVQQVAELTVPAVADYCSVHLLEPDGSIRTLALAGRPSHLEAARRFLDLRAPLLDDPTGVGAVVRDGQPLIVDRVDEATVRQGLADQPAVLEAALALDAYADMTVPLIAGGKTIGALALTSTTESGRSFELEDLALAEELASRAALAIDNARLYEALLARESQQAAVARLGQLALDEQEIPPLLDAIVVELAKVLEVEFAKILELQPGGRTLKLVAGVGWRPGLVGELIVAAGLESQAGYALEIGAPVTVEDLGAETRFQDPAMLEEHGVVSGMSAIIPGRDGPWGVLGIHTAHRRTFSVDDTNFLVAVTNLLAGSIVRRRRMDEERQAQDLNRAFIGIVSHELRTPITTIYGGAKMLRRLEPDDPDRQTIADDIEVDAERLYRLTEDLLVMTRLERHDLEIGTEPVLVSRLLERVVGSEQRRWPGVSMRVTLPPKLDPVIGEDIYVEQVIRNLVGNAAKYSPQGTAVDIVAEQLDEEVTVRVLDRGPGIRGEDPERLFALFYRAPSTAQQASGAGIGLFVCDQLVRAMGGRLWARAREEGGSEFGFALRRYGEDDDVTLAPPLDVVAHELDAAEDGAPATVSGMHETNGASPHEPVPLHAAGSRGDEDDVVVRDVSPHADRAG